MAKTPWSFDHSECNTVKQTYSLPTVPPCHDCPLYLASVETVCNVLLPARTAIHENGLLLTAETVSMIVFPVEILGRKQNRTDLAASCLICTTVFAGSNNGRQSELKPNPMDSLGRKQKVYKYPVFYRD